MTRTLIASLAVLMAGVLAFAGLTRGFKRWLLRRSQSLN